MAADGRGWEGTEPPGNHKDTKNAKENDQEIRAGAGLGAEAPMPSPMGPAHRRASMEYGQETGLSNWVLVSETRLV